MVSSAGFPSYRGEMRYACLGCGANHGIDELLYTCPGCGEELGHAVLSGRELYIEYLELE